MIGLLLLIHFVADFVLQSREMGKKKSSEIVWLLKHLRIQYWAFALVLLPFVDHWPKAFVFAGCNAIIHGVIDWNIWRGYKYIVYRKLLKDNTVQVLLNAEDPEHQEQGRIHLEWLGKNWQYWEDHLFYTTIGFDQLLHGLTLVFLAHAFHL